MKKKFHSSTNTISNKFLIKTIIMNIVSFWKCQEAISRPTKVTLYGNCHSFVIKLLNILLLVKHIIEDLLFHEQLGQTRIQNNTQELTFLDLFIESNVRLSTSIEFPKYIFSARGNQDNNNSNKSDDNNIASKVKDNDNDENIRKKSPNNPYKLYSIYN